MATNEKIHIKTTINGNPEEFLADPHVSLLDALREIVGLTGSKEGCLDGNCGACTVSINGRIVDSCLVLAAEVDGKMLIQLKAWQALTGYILYNKLFSKKQLFNVEFVRQVFWFPLKGY